MSGSPDELGLKQMGNLLGVRRPKDGGEQTLIRPPSEEPAPPAPPTPGFVYLLAFFSALGGFLFGYDTGVVSGAMLPLKKEMHLDKLWQELLVSSTVGAAALSALGGGVLNGWLGRRICILIASFVFGVGGVILGLAPSKEVLLVGRVTVGLGIGESSPAPSGSSHPGPGSAGQSQRVFVAFLSGLSGSSWGQSPPLPPAPPAQPTASVLLPLVGPIARHRLHDGSGLHS